MRLLIRGAFVIGLALVCGLGVVACRRQEPVELIILGVPQAEVRATLARHGATRINDLVGPISDQMIDWYVASDRTCMQIRYDRDLRLVEIVLGSAARGWYGLHDWERQQKTIVKQLELR
jgi:hypothetical protein